MFAKVLTVVLLDGGFDVVDPLEFLVGDGVPSVLFGGGGGGGGGGERSHAEFVVAKALAGLLMVLSNQLLHLISYWL